MLKHYACWKQQIMKWSSYKLPVMILYLNVFPILSDTLHSSWKYYRFFFHKKLNKDILQIFPLRCKALLWKTGYGITLITDNGSFSEICYVSVKLYRCAVRMIEMFNMFVYFVTTLASPTLLSTKRPWPCTHFAILETRVAHSNGFCWCVGKYSP